MADILIGYAVDDSATAHEVADILEGRGWSVALGAGVASADRTSAEDDRELAAARCAVFLWSASSVEDHELARQAFKAFRRDILISVLIDDVRPPLLLRPFPTVLLNGTHGRISNLGRHDLIRAVSGVFGLSARLVRECADVPELIEFFDNGSRLTERLAPYRGGERLRDVLDGVRDGGDPQCLKTFKPAQMELVAEMLAANRPAWEVQHLLTRTNISLYRRNADVVLAEMMADGWGDLPVPATILMTGSGGRGENLPFSDQDSAIILADYPDSQHAWVDAFFREFAERLCIRLDLGGIPFCNGYCMAVNPLWRKTLSQWMAQVGGWVDKSSCVSLRLADVFFDFQPVWGDAQLARGLRRAITEKARTNALFLRRMLELTADHGVALGFFGGLTTDRDQPHHLARLDVKYGGIIPLVEAVRLLALRAGVEETSTLARMRVLNQKGVLTDDESDDLTSAFHVFTDFLLQKGLDDYQAGRRSGYGLIPDALGAHDRDRLKQSLRTVGKLRRYMTSQIISAAA